MTANELADDAKNINNTIEALEWVQKVVPMLRQQQAEIEQLKALAISLSPNSNLIYTRSENE
jgi:hypothetical protein